MVPTTAAEPAFTDDVQKKGLDRSDRCSSRRRNVVRDQNSATRVHREAIESIRVDSTISEGENPPAPIAGEVGSASKRGTICNLYVSILSKTEVNFEDDRAEFM